MKTLTVRLPESLLAQIEAESRRRKLSKSDVVRERLTGAAKTRGRGPRSLDAIADLVGSVDGLPRDLSSRTKKYLKSTGYGIKRAR
jgi:Arc/MetJ-type ribon-helix-helix transcriptional regulator